jgi:hypothetical protein
MAKIAVYHMTRTAFRDGLDNVGRMRDDEDALLATVVPAIENGSYVYCARVRSEPFAQDHLGADPTGHLERVWRDTNNIDAPWTENESVIYSAGREQRSSMVGDIFVFDNEAYVVGSFGFKKMPNAAQIAELLAQHAKPGIS